MSDSKTPAPPSPAPTSSTPSETTPQESLSPMDFSMFILSLASSAMVNMGKVSSPDGQEHPVDLSAAKQLIDVLAVLHDKTRGNLDEGEGKLLASLLYDLRVNYVDAQKATAP